MGISDLRAVSSSNVPGKEGIECIRMVQLNSTQLCLIHLKKNGVCMSHTKFLAQWCVLPHRGLLTLNIADT